MTKRHDEICDKLYYFCQLAGLDVQQEQRYEIDVNNNKVRIEGRPGDIKINNYYTETTLPENMTDRDVYIDVTVANICADTYIKQASKKRAVIAQAKEKHKLKKYQNNPNIMGIGMETFGKTIINYLANRLSLLHNIPYSIWINRIRSNLLAVLMQQNAQMIISFSFSFSL